MNPRARTAFVSQPLVSMLTLLGVFTGSIGLGMVWSRYEISLTANRSRVCEAKIAEVERHINEVGAEIDSASTPEELARQNDAMRLGLMPPREPQVVRLAEQPEIRLAAKRRQEIYADATLTPVVFRTDRMR
jgi:hypothetical protein